MEKTKVKKKGNKSKKTNRKVSLYSVIILIVILAVIIYGIYALVSGVYYYFKYDKYEDKMIQYGLNDLYNNNEASTRQNVTNSEMVKVVVGSILGTKDVSGLVYMENSKSYENEEFVKYAESVGIIEKGSITKSNESDKARYGQTTETVYNAIKVILKSDDIDIKDNGKSNLKKGQLNKLVIETVEKYNTLYKGSIKGANLVTDEDKLPKNYKDYPYIIDSIPTEVYEMELQCLSEERFMNPKKEYEKRGEVYSQIDNYLTKYYNQILNVDYETINEQEFFNNIKDIVYYKYTDDSMHEYIEYVKENKIKLKGKITPYLPIIYYDGEVNRVRAKIEFEVLSSNTDKNLLLPDIFNGDNIKYEGKKFEFYIDIPMGAMLGATSLRVTIESLPSNLITEGIKITRIEE